MITDLVQIKRYGEKQREENQRFRTWLKRHNFLERRFKAIAQNVEESIDCTGCANCCRVATTQISERDTARLARYLGVSISDFLRDYTVETEDEGRILKRDENGCIFLTSAKGADMRPEAVKETADPSRGALDAATVLRGSLKRNFCSVYEARPQTCQLFPHLVKGNGSLISRMWHMPDRAVYCPIVFNTLEQFKAETGFKK